MYEGSIAAATLMSKLFDSHQFHPTTATASTATITTNNAATTVTATTISTATTTTAAANTIAPTTELRCATAFRVDGLKEISDELLYLTHGMLQDETATNVQCDTNNTTTQQQYVRVQQYETYSSNSTTTSVARASGIESNRVRPIDSMRAKVKIDLPGSATPRNDETTGTRNINQATKTTKTNWTKRRKQPKKLTKRPR